MCLSQPETTLYPHCLALEKLPSTKLLLEVKSWRPLVLRILVHGMYVNSAGLPSLSLHALRPPLLSESETQIC